MSVAAIASSAPALTTATTAAPVASRPPECSEQHGRGHAYGRRMREQEDNPLVAAMMEALKGLMSGGAATGSSTTAAATTTASTATGTAAVAAATKVSSTTAATATTATSATSTTTATAAATANPATPAAIDERSLKEATFAFAHELFHALRAAGSGGGEQGDQGEGRVHGQGQGHQRSHGQGWGGRMGYDDLAQRLQTLASQFAPPAATAPAAGAATTTSTSTTPASTATPVQAVPASTTPAAAPAAPSPLLSAFSKLVSALNPNGGGTGGTAAQLSSFLSRIAGALGTQPQIAQVDAAPKGSLLSIAA